MNYTNKTEEEIKDWLKANLTDEKFIHSQGVKEMACTLAEKFNIDIEKAKVAGLLHDCAKGFPVLKMLDIIRAEKLDVTQRELLAQKTLHAPVGAYVAQKEFGVENAEILSAIRFHTIAKEDMSDLEKIIFISDKIETKTREAGLTKQVMLLLDEPNGLNNAMYFLLSRTLKYLNTQGAKNCDETVSLCDYFKELR